MPRSRRLPLAQPVPLKWRKYLALVDFGFITADELEADIHRYRRGELHRLVSAIRSDIREEHRQSSRSIYVVKLVPADLPGQLPNCRLEDTSELKQLLGFLDASEAANYIEAWYCRTRVDSDVFSVGGRIVFAATDTGRTQIVEQLWRGSPRLLESYSDDFAFPYVRASRYSWGWPYSIEHIHLPRIWPLNIPRISRSQLHSEFGYSMRCIEQEKEKIEAFCAFLDSFSFKAYSLEYKIVGGQIKFIDWDTPNDKQVLRSSGVHLAR
jgi:hypothetical protein